MQEIEIKLALPTASKSLVMAQLHTMFGRHHELLALNNIYFDTEDFRLRQMKWALRIRDLGEGTFEQTVKGQGSAIAGLHSRIEHNWSLSAPQLDYEKLSEVTEFPVLTGSQIQEAFRTDFQRTLWLIESGQGTIELVCDCGEIQSKDKFEPIFEIELELKNGSLDALLVLTEKLVSLVPCWLFVPSKAARGYGLLKGRAIFDAGQLAGIDTLIDWVDVAGCMVQELVNGSGEMPVESFARLIARLRELVTHVAINVQPILALLSESEGLLSAKTSEELAKKLCASTWLGRVGLVILKAEAL